MRPSLEVLHSEAKRLQRAGELTSADDVCRQILSAKPGDANGHHLRGQIALQAGRFDVAIEALEKAVESGKLLMTATEQSIKGGVRINLDLLNAQQQLYTSQRDLAQARYTYLIALLRLRAAAGTLDSSAVREVAAYFR